MGVDVQLHARSTFSVGRGERITGIDVGTEARRDKGRRRRRLVLAFLLAGAIIWGGWAWWMDWRYRNAMAEIESEMATGRFAIAARNLVKLLAWKPDSDEAAYLLGTCEQARGRNQEAEEAWARVVPGSAFWERAIMARLRLFHDGGRLADAEQLIKRRGRRPPK